MKESPQAFLSKAARSVVLPPGAAQRSSTLNGLFFKEMNSLAIRPTDIAEESWT